MDHFVMKRFLSWAFSVALIFSFCSQAVAAPISEAFQVNCSPYECVQSAYGSSALSIITDQEMRNQIQQYNIDNGLELCAVISKSVFVKEEFDSNGEFVSRLMTNAEVHQIELQAPNNTVASTNNSDTNGRGNLTITLTVSANARHQVVLNGYAKWNTTYLTNEGSVYPHYGDDFMAICWKGNGDITADSHLCIGKYTNGDDMPCYRSGSDATAGYYWAFEDKTALWGKVMDHVSSTIVLSSSNNSATPYRNARAGLVYIHTYDKANVSVSCSFNPKEIAASLTVNNTSKSWSLAVDVGFMY